MDDPIEVLARDLPAMIARLRAQGKRASTITAVGTNGYLVTVAPAPMSPARAKQPEHRTLNAEALAALCQRLKSQGVKIASVRTLGEAQYAIWLVDEIPRRDSSATVATRESASLGNVCAGRHVT